MLFRDVEGLPSQSLPWDLSSWSKDAHPCAFVPLVDTVANTTLAGSRKALKAEATAPGRSLRKSTTFAETAQTAPAVSHSADRLAKAIVLATRSARDPRTLAHWGQEVGVSRGALRVWCKAADESARSCLDFLRVLRAVIQSRNQVWDLLSILDVVDRRSLLNLLNRGGIRELCRRKQPTIDEFMRRQRYLGNRELLNAVRRQLN